MDGKEDPSARKRNAEDTETKGGVRNGGKKSVLLLPDDKQETLSAGDAVRPDQAAAGDEAQDGD